jgi:hypothetical protein
MTLMHFPIRGISMRAVLQVWLLSLLFAFASVLSLYPVSFVPLGPILNGIVSPQVYAFSVMLAVILVEGKSSPGGASVWRYTIAVMCGVGAGVVFYWLVSQRLIGITTVQRGPEGYEPLVSFAFRHGPLTLTVCGLATAVYVCRSRANRGLESLRALKRERVQVEKDIAEARLAALHARIEPTDVLAKLERIEQLYDRDPPAADRMLDEFVKALRAAIHR